MKISIEIKEEWVLGDDKQLGRYNELEESIISIIEKWHLSYRYNRHTN